MSVKAELRKELLKKRRQVVDKKNKDEIICNRLINFEHYIEASQVLLFSALEDEINIDSVIADALESGKRVALPKCLDKKGSMNFYYINSFDDLKEGFFGLKEPDVNCERVTDFEASLCVVPAVCYDKKGFRLGYGRGYYDRFLKNYISKSVGLCYNELLVDDLPVEDYDIPVGSVITD